MKVSIKPILLVGKFSQKTKNVLDKNDFLCSNTNVLNNLMKGNSMGRIEKAPEIIKEIIEQQPHDLSKGVQMPKPTPRPTVINTSTRANNIGSFNTNTYSMARQMGTMSKKAKETLATNPEYHQKGSHGPGSRPGMGRGGQIYSRTRAPKTGPDI